MIGRAARPLSILQRSARCLATTSTSGITGTSVDVHTHKLDRPTKAPRALKREAWVRWKVVPLQDL